MFVAQKRKVNFNRCCKMGRG